MELTLRAMKYRIVRVMSILLGMIFLVSGILKVEDVDSFIGSVRSFGLLPELVVPLFSMIIVAMEVICGALLLFGSRRKEVTEVLLMMMLIFTAAVVNALLAGGEQMCGCFGDRYSGQIDQWTVVRNIALMALLAVLHRASSEPGPPQL